MCLQTAWPHLTVENAPMLEVSPFFYPTWVCRSMFRLLKTTTNLFYTLQTDNFTILAVFVLYSSNTSGLMESCNFLGYRDCQGERTVLLFLNIQAYCFLGFPLAVTLETTMLPSIQCQQNLVFIYSKVSLITQKHCSMKDIKDLHWKPPTLSELQAQRNAM